MSVTDAVLRELPSGWERTTDSNGLVLHSPDVGTETGCTVSWWGAHHSGLYVEAYDYAVVVPLSVVATVLDAAGFTVTRKEVGA